MAGRKMRGGDNIDQRFWCSCLGICPTMFVFVNRIISTGGGVFVCVGGVAGFGGAESEEIHHNGRCQGVARGHSVGWWMVSRAAPRKISWEEKYSYIFMRIAFYEKSCGNSNTPPRVRCKKKHGRGCLFRSLFERITVLLEHETLDKNTPSFSFDDWEFWCLWNPLVFSPLPKRSLCTENVGKKLVPQKSVVSTDFTCERSLLFSIKADVNKKAAGFSWYPDNSTSRECALLARRGPEIKYE